MTTEPLACHQFREGEIEAALEFLKGARSDLRALRKVRVWADRVQVFDVNGDYFEVRGLGYGDPDVTDLLDSVNTVFRPDSIHQPTQRPFKEYKTGRHDPWAKDRIL